MTLGLESVDIDSFLNLNLRTSGNNGLIIQGFFNKIYPDNSKIYYEAPDSANLRSSYTGSGLPYPNKDFAYTHKSNCGVVDLNYQLSGFHINMTIPNSYYKDTNGHIQEPYILLKFMINGKQLEKKINLNKYTNRALTYDINRTSPEFYSIGWKQPVRTQESILYARGMPQFELHNYSSNEAKYRNELSENDKNGRIFFGLRPPA